MKYYKKDNQIQKDITIETLSSHSTHLVFFTGLFSSSKALQHAHIRLSSLSDCMDVIGHISLMVCPTGNSKYCLPDRKFKILVCCDAVQLLLGGCRSSGRPGTIGGGLGGLVRFGVGLAPPGPAGRLLQEHAHLALLARRHQEAAAVGEGDLPHAGREVGEDGREQVVRAQQTTARLQLVQLDDVDAAHLVAHHQELEGGVINII